MEIGYCPFCGGMDCRHFLGWTEDGESFFKITLEDKTPIPESAKMVNTGVTTRVYSDEKEVENGPSRCGGAGC